MMQMHGKPTFFKSITLNGGTHGQNHQNYNLRSDLDQSPAAADRDDGIQDGNSNRKSAKPGTEFGDEWFRLLFENAPDAIVIYDADEHRFIDANMQAELLFGCNLVEIIKQGPGHFYSPDQPDRRPVPESVAQNDARALAGERLTYERRIRRPTGEERICLVTMVRLPSKTRHLLRGSLVDITERDGTEQELKRTNRALRTLSRGSAVVVHAASEPELLNDMCRVIVEDGGYRMAWIGEVQHDASKSVRFVAWAGKGADRLAPGQGVSWAEEPAGSGPTGMAIRTGQPQTSQNVLGDPSMVLWVEEAKEYGISSVLTLPLKHRSSVFAVLRIFANEPNAFDGAEVSLLQELADGLSYGINTLRDRSKHALVEQRWRSGLEATIRAIANMLEMRDPYTSGHQQRAANLAVAIAQALRWSDDETEGLYLASIVHDVGKVTIPAEILNKPGKLSKIEYALIQEHAEAGYNVLKGIDFPWPVAEMVRQHHERLDGSGYPRGLKNDAILPGAKILAVADIVDAMMSHRPYRPALGIELALAEIEKSRGQLFDPAVVDACTTLIRQKGFRLDHH
jgi:PAS domain S-box-containing protein